MNLKKEQDEISVLLKIESKLHGIGHLIRWSQPQIELNQDEINHGIGDIISQIADEISFIRNRLEQKQLPKI